MAERAAPFRLARRFVPAGAYYAFLCFLSSRSSFPVESPFSGFDKLAHLGLFGVLGVLLAWAMTGPGDRWTFGRAALAFGLGVLGGALDEIHQIFVPGRTADVWDAAADAAGIAAGIGLFILVRIRARKTEAR